MRNFSIILLGITFVSYSCTKAVNTTYQPPKAIASDWDTLKPIWDISGSIYNYILVPNLDSSMLFYGTVRIFIKNTLAADVVSSIPMPINRLGFLSSSFLNNSKEFDFFTELKRLNLIINTDNLTSDFVVGLTNRLNVLKSSMYFRYIMIPGASNPNARIQAQNIAHSRTMDYHSLCTYLNIKE